MALVGRDPFAEFRPRAPSQAAEFEGYSIHASVRIAADDPPSRLPLRAARFGGQAALRRAGREGLERVCRYILRPPFSVERFRELPDGRIVYEMRRAWADGTSHVVLSPMELIEKLAALIPSPRQHLLVYHGVFGPSAKWRPLIVAECDEGPTCRKRGRHRCRAEWAELMKRTFKLDVLDCPKCGGRMELIAIISDVQSDVVRKILRCLEMEEELPPLGPASADLTPEARNAKGEATAGKPARAPPGSDAECLDPVEWDEWM